MRDQLNFKGLQLTSTRRLVMGHLVYETKVSPADSSRVGLPFVLCQRAYTKEGYSILIEFSEMEMLTEQQRRCVRVATILAHEYDITLTDALKKACLLEGADFNYVYSRVKEVVRTTRGKTSWGWL